MSVPNVIIIHLIVVEILQSRPKWWIDWPLLHNAKKIVFFHVWIIVLIFLCVYQGWDDPDMWAVPVCASCPQLVWEAAVSHRWGVVEWALEPDRDTPLYTVPPLVVCTTVPSIISISPFNKFKQCLSLHPRQARSDRTEWLTWNLCLLYVFERNKNLEVGIWDSPPKILITHFSVIEPRSPGESQQSGPK